jgi:tetratricopeptide (TPR) repeat protein
LQELSQKTGVQRADLLEALADKLSELRRCWGINLAYSTDEEREQTIKAARQIIRINLDRHIAALHPMQRAIPNVYRYAVNLGFNLQTHPEQVHLRDKDITRRRNWLEHEAPIHLRVSASTSYRYVADAITQIEQQILASDYEPVQTETLDEPEQVLIARDEYLARLRGHIDTGNRIICIWGEPGTGKTMLAKQFAVQIDSHTPALTIRVPPVLEAPTAESLLFRQDLTEALIAEGLEPTNWSLEYALARFRARVGEKPRAKAVVIDNVQGEELIWQLIPPQPNVPVIITMQSRPQSQTIACEELHGFTEAQAYEFISCQLPDENKQEAVDLARTLGYRPLALEHAVLFIKESPDISVRSLTHRLAIQVTDTLAAVTPPEQRERNISRLYELILVSLLEYEPGKVLLDTFLGMAGQNGVDLRESVFAFMQSEYGGSHDRLYFRTGLRELLQRGLLREQDVSEPLTSARTSPPVVELSMHPLTYRILHGLRGRAPLEIETRYLDYIRATDLETSDSASGTGRIRAWAVQQFMNLAQEGLPDGWLSLRAVDDHTWVAVQEPPEGAGSREPYTVRYAIGAEGSLYKLNYHAGQWSELDAEEIRTLRLTVLVFAERGRPEFTLLASESTSTDGPQVPEARLDPEETLQDDYGHSPIDPVSVKYYIRHGIALWVLCGKRFIPTSVRGTVNCPDCKRISGSTERLSEIEVTLRRNFFTLLSVKQPLVAAYLFLIRAKLRRGLERFEEAAQDLVFSYDFLQAVTESSKEGEWRAVGAGIILVASSLPDARQDWITEVSEHLMEGMESTDPDMVFLLHNRSQSLEKLGQIADALADLDQIIALVDAGTIDRKDVDVELEFVFYKKEELERQLGRIDDANATMRRFISEAEKRDDGGRALAAALYLSGMYLRSDDPEQARNDFQRAMNIAQAQEPPNYETAWNCLVQLVSVAEEQNEVTYALHAAERALRLVDEHLPDRTDLREQSLGTISRIKGELPDDTS